MNNENLTVHFKVKDFNVWRTSYNGHEKDRVLRHHKRESVPKRRRSERRSDPPGCGRCIEGPHLVGLK